MYTEDATISFLNRAAVITDGDVDAADAAAPLRPWRVCTVRQVEDLKAVLRILPLWSSSIFLSISIGVQLNFTVLQALAMDRAIGRFHVPAASMVVSSFVAVVVTLYYQEFPPSLKNTASGMVAMIVALGFYLSTALVDAVRRATAWLPDNMNASRLENLYWLLAVLVAINFGYYLACAKLYKYQNFGK
uniref:Uncharacterized protein n=1 Tax=Oryza barthii TaxID=65489 RepID=A0A0D3G6A2_9ORYZ